MISNYSDLSKPFKEIYILFTIQGYALECRVNTQRWYVYLFSLLTLLSEQGFRATVGNY